MGPVAEKPIILVDGSSYLYRAFHALPPLTNSKGHPTGAVYGVINMIRRLINDYQPEQIAVVFDPKGKTFRDELYPEYKANREAMPNELVQQIEPLFAIIRAMGLPLIIVDGVEADDVIGTLAKQATAARKPMLISTGDKDMAQLVNDDVTLINTMTGKIFDPAGVEEKFGVPPELIIDYLTLIGDSVDNIPGVKKVGPKTAVKWLMEYQSLQGVVESAEKITGKVGEYLREALPQLPLSKQLVTIKTDVELPFNLGELTPRAADNLTLATLFKEMEFKKWLSEALNENEEEKKELNYEILFQEKEFTVWLEKIKAAKLFAFDTETTSLNYMDAELVGVSFAIEENNAAYVPFSHDYEEVPQQLAREWVLQQLKPLLEDENLIKVGHNLKYDRSVLANYGIELRGIGFDTMLESFLLTSAARNDMDSLALKYLGVETIHFEDIAGKGAKQLTFNQIPIDQAGPYAAEDADITLKLHHKLWPTLQQESGLRFIFGTIEMPLLPILSKVERNGVLLDSELLHRHSKTMAARIDVLEQQAHEMAGKVFNLSSTKQLQEILFEELKLPVLQKTPKGQPSTAENVLQELAHDYPLPKVILEYRSLAKLKSTYTDKLPLLVNSKTGRVHTSYHQAGAQTGRFSSSDPNLQNIPARTEEGRKIRQAFIAEVGSKIVAVDYSQIELRIMAHLSEDKGLLDAKPMGLFLKAPVYSESGVFCDSSEYAGHAILITQCGVSGTGSEMGQTITEDIGSLNGKDRFL